MSTQHHIEETAIGLLGIKKDSDIGRFVLHIRENPTAYAAGLLLIVLAIFAGLFWRNASRAAEERVMSDYAAAVVDTEDEAIRATKLETVAQSTSGRWAPEVVYMSGEAALAQAAYDKAEAAFNRVLKEFPQSEYASRAAEGLGYIAEAKGDLKAALQTYQDVATKYEKTFTGKLQQNNVGRVQEALGDFAGAVAAYQKQISAFPDSKAAARAQEALDRLKDSHADLFPEEKKAEAPAAAAAPAPAPAPAAQ